MIKYKKAIVTFIDVLGFRQLLTLNDAAIVHGVLHEFYHENAITDQRQGFYKLDVHIFSDCVVRVLGLEPDRSLGYWPSPIFAEMTSLQDIQFLLACRGIHIRGGVSFGEVYSEKGTVFGPALVEAYDTEQETAIYPRIAVSKNLVTAFYRGELRSGFAAGDAGSNWDRTTFEESLLTDESGVVFLDYLANLRNGSLDYILRHKRNILRKAAGSEDIRHLKKLSWLAHYHNQTVSSPSALDAGITSTNKPDFIIDNVQLLSLTSPKIQAYQNPELPWEESWEFRPHNS